MCGGHCPWAAIERAMVAVVQLFLNGALEVICRSSLPGRPKVRLHLFSSGVVGKVPEQ